MVRIVRHWWFFGGRGGIVEIGGRDVGRGGGEGDFRGTYKRLLYTGPGMVDDGESSSEEE